MKAAILTFQQTNNYGAILQNYALQHTINKLGYDADTIDYQSDYISKPYKICHLKNKGLFPYLFGVAGYLIYALRTSKCKHFRKNISYSLPAKYPDLSALNDQYDIFITGSDQVWNYKLTGMDTAFLLDFVADKRKCASYAASLGVNCLDKDIAPIYKDLLNNYKLVSVREEQAKQTLSSILSAPIEVVSDPCLLLTPDEWLSVAAPNIPKKPYIAIYQLGFSSDVVKLAKKIAKEKHLGLIFLPFPVGTPAFGKYAFNAGPAELVNYIAHADYVITDSFHGTLFSILFHKQFFTKVSGTHAGVGSRIHDLLSHYNLSDRIIAEQVNYKDPIDYTVIDSIIEKDRAHSLQVLQNIFL